ncbi:pyocin knob domain-containing protein [Citrobacter sp. Awk 4]|uniref:pyocin knob domain-containing protein n=1 Tax=Citrobacter sp. Awk 4 TaxID=2963955 RepID=UPI002302C42F|nr:pyocin knob domain-containing protein [Citrobacter sp. Awk 4]MDA8481263.1 pyocin knob domain-containing protein [Citrobacter sp. Awk 4]
MIYNTGTISVSGNTAAGSGTNWIAPASQIRAGQTIIVLSNPVQMFQITTVNSATSLTLTPAASPALSGQKYGILVTDGLSVDGLAQSISQLIKEYDENIGAWESFASTTANQNVTVTINGVSFTIPAIGKLVQKGANGAVPIESGGTGATTKEDARTNLGLGSSATRNTYSISGDLLSIGDFGVGSSRGDAASIPDSVVGNSADLKAGFYASNGDFIGSPGGIGNGQFLGVIAYNCTNNNLFKYQIAGSYSSSGRMFFRSMNNGTYNAWRELYHTGNTTKASDGTLKAASPVIRIVKSQEENLRTDIDEGGFTWAGAGTVNAEAEGVKITRKSVGVYAVTGAASLAKSGWQLLPPMDPGGMGNLGIVDAEQGDSLITIKLYRLKYSINAAGEIEKGKGDLMDVPGNSWIDVRLDMPDNSAFNLKTNV